MSLLAMNSLYSSNHKERKRNLSNSWKIIWPMPGFEPGAATPNVNVVYYGDVFSKGNIKIIVKGLNPGVISKG